MSGLLRPAMLAFMTFFLPIYSKLFFNGSVFLCSLSNEI